MLKGLVTGIRWAATVLLLGGVLSCGGSGGSGGAAPTPTPDFTFSVTAPGPMLAGGSGGAAVTASRTGGHAAAITLSLASNAQGITGSGSIAAGSDTGALALSVPGSVSGGTYTLVASGSDGTRIRTASFSLAVTPASAPDFTLTAMAPGPVTAGGSGSTAIRATRTSGHSAAITLSLLANAQGITGSGRIDAGSDTGVLALLVPGSVPEGAYPLTASGSDGALVRTAALSLAVVAAPAPDFSLAVAVPGHIAPGAGGSAAVAVTRTYGHASAITLSLQVNAQGITGSGALAAGSGSGTLTLAVPGSVAPGTYPLVLLGSDGTLVRSAGFSLPVAPDPQPDFTLGATSDAVIAAGGSGASTVLASRTAGHAAAITLAIAGAPAGVTGHGSIPAGATSGTLTLAVVDAVPAGTYLLRVDGSDGTLTRSTVMNLTTTAAPSDLTLTGNAGAPGARLAYVPGGGSVLADAGGDYRITVPRGWSGSVTPGLEGYAFTPPARSYANVSSSLAGEDFSARKITLAISGNTGVGDVRIDHASGPLQSDGSGNYRLEVDYGWSGTLTPSKPGYTFAPAHLTYASLSSNQSAQNFTATPDGWTVTPSAGPHGSIAPATPQKVAGGATVTFTAAPDDGYAVDQWYWNGASVLAGSASYTTPPVTAEGSTVRVTFKALPRIVLLLHGMNSNPSTWSDFVSSQGGASAQIFAGVVPTGTPTPDAKGVLYYAVDFGSRDLAYGRTGLEGLSPATDPNRPDTRGDYSTFADLGIEVEQAVTGLLARYPGVRIFLVAHSRGGLAARAFLQGGAEARDSVVALLTIGTPHKGSPLGRIYPYLGAHPQPQDAETWKVVKFLDGTEACSFIYNTAPLNVRKPTIDDFAASFTIPGGSELAGLNGGIGGLPGIVYGSITSTGVVIGRIHSIYGIFQSDGSWCNQLSSAAETYLLDGHPLADYVGDGIVPAWSQIISGVSGFPGGTHYSLEINASVLHTDETGRSSELRQMMLKMVPWWN